MPLTEPVEREPIHTRTVTCRGFRRADGLWDIEGHLVDTKAYSFESRWRGTLEPGTPVHGMWLRLTVDDDMVVRGCEAAMDATPFAVCPSITPAFQALVGLAIVPGWTAKVKQLLGGIQGCTHLVELLGPVATTAFQSIYPYRERARTAKGAADATPVEKTPINTCHALRSDGQVVKELWPAHYTGE